MLTKDNLHDYQKKAVNFQVSKPSSMLWLDMGLGKTCITLTSIAHMLQSGQVNKVIIVAPVRVVRMVWRQEALKWEHTKDLRFSMVTGSRDQRSRALLIDADIYLINYENLRWLSEVLQIHFIDKNKPIPFNGIVWDEISKMKNSTTQRVKSFMKIYKNFKWFTGLTGTPASNGYKDLHGQYLVIDGGVRLGVSKTKFKTKFYKKVGPFKEVPYPDTEGIIKQLISDITLEMSAEDYNPLPDLVINDVNIDLPNNLRAKYESLERDFFYQLDSGNDVEVFNQAALTNKCLQFSNGATYPISGVPVWEKVHDLKLDALEDILEEAGGAPILCSYSYRSDAECIMERFKDIRPINLTECKSDRQLNDAMERWKSGDCQLMIGHPACLHPSTKVLTERRGWVKIIDVNKSDRVFDGVEFVNHDGCSYSGIKEVITVFGLTMTLNHKLLIGDDWVEAKDVRDNKRVRREALYEYKGDDESISEMFTLWRPLNNGETKCSEAQSNEERVLFKMCEGSIPHDDRDSYLENMVWNETSSERHRGQKLRTTWYKVEQSVARFQKLLRGYVTNLQGWINNRTNRCKWKLLQRKLYLGDKYETAIEQENQSVLHVRWGKDSSCRVMSENGVKQNGINFTVKQRNVGRRCDRGCTKFLLREERIPKECKEKVESTTSKVYDLVNCGKRNRFVIMNDEGETFISHNSMGHGIDGLQNNGHILVWYGLTWSLDLYEQFNARIRRQGQGVPVICHRLMIPDTLDDVQRMALDDKAVTQADLRNAIKQYQISKLG